MKSIFIYISMLTLITAQTSTIQMTSKCLCSQLMAESDCLLLGNCFWDPQASKCSVAASITTTEIYSFCTQFPQKTCAYQNGCLWTNNACTFFTGCTPFLFKTDSECQAISSKCITDGTRCIQLGVCSSYTTELSCVKNLLGKYCYWDTAKCSDADECSKLPAILDTDEKCRAQISNCTVGTSGCTLSGLDCSDQKLENQCIWDRAQKQKCFWNGICGAQTCDNAPAVLVTDEQCKSYNSICTTKFGGGCITRSTCVAVSVEAGCVKNSLGSDCYWNGINCVDLTCDALAVTFSTNEQCGTMKMGCITKKGGGCIENGECQQATISSACVKNSEGKDCFWDIDECKLKTCSNAPYSLVTYIDCNNFLSNCTLNLSKIGCVEKSCENAPTAITNMSDCEKYLENKNCISKKSGGCMTRGNCDQIELQESCTVDKLNQECYWTVNGCKLKECTNTTVLDSEEKCNLFSPKCTLNSYKNGCVDKLCPLISTSQYCIADYNKYPCVWKESCYEKTCTNASQVIDNHAQCNGWLSTCTVNPNRKGCMDIPSRCSVLTEPQCYLNSNNQQCAWDGKTCTLKSCLTALPYTYYTSTYICSQYLPQCVVNSNNQGCIELPTTCSPRNQNICTIKLQNDDPICVYRNDSCMDISCNFANGPDYNDNSKCMNYYKNCIVNSTLNGCIKLPTICGGQIQQQCGNGSRQNGDCFWDGTQCLEKQCNFANETFNSVTKCQSWKNTCTTSPRYSLGCVSKQSTCLEMGQYQCVSTILNQSCYWNTTDQNCYPQICANAPVSVKTFEECQAFLNNCTLNSAKNGCIPIKDNCSSYSESECYQSKLQGLCFWDSGSCIKATCLKTTQPSPLSLENCIALKNLSCTYVVGQSTCLARTCSGSTGPSSPISQSNCQAWLSDCAINQNMNACITQRDNCADYTNLLECGFSKLEGRCYVLSGKCTKVTSCQKVFQLTFNTDTCNINSDLNCTISGLCIDKPCSRAPLKTTHSQCQSFSNRCAINSGSNDCVPIQITCTDYTLLGTCAQSQEGRCQWNPTANNSLGACLDASCTDAPIKTSQSACQTYSKKCAINQAQNDCITIAKVCADYKSSIYCGHSLEGKCKLSGNLCIIAPCTEAPIKNSNQNCQDYSQNCVINSTLNECLSIKNTCNLSLTQIECNYSREGQCFWDYSGNNNKGGCINSPCSNASSQVTQEDCQNHNKNCAINQQGNACISMLENCTSYTQAQCKWSRNQGQCLWDAGENNGNGGCIKATCISASQRFTNYNLSLCEGITDLQCTFEMDSSCSERKCSGPYGPKSIPNTATQTQNDCQNWSKNCSINASKDGCVDYLDNCTYKSQNDCVWSRNGGRCTWLNEVCMQASCTTVKLPIYSQSSCVDLVDLNCFYFPPDSTCQEKQCNGQYGPSYKYTTFEECQTWSPYCSVNSLKNGCISLRAKCSFYSQAECVQSSSSICLWDTTLSVCRDLLCTDADLTLTSHTDCESFLPICTIQKAGGCIDLLETCISYQTKQQCYMTKSGGQCYWSNSEKCVDFTCEIVDQVGEINSINTCESLNQKCTVRSLGYGCADKTECSKYKGQQQCVKSLLGETCLWIENSCQVQSCYTAPQSYDSHEFCYSYLTTGLCTLHPSGKGCLPLAECTQYGIVGQCQINLKGQKCIWNSIKLQCEDLSCQNAPITAKSTSACENHSKLCTYEGSNCRQRQCVDFSLDTDEKCRNALPNSQCTTNGSICVTKTTCELTIYQKACLTDINNVQCAWVISYDNQPAYCTIMNCLSAPKSMISESECQRYLSGCTTKFGGGCILKSDCSSANVQTACTVDLNGNKCVWDKDLCRNIKCEDYNELSFVACQTINPICTTSGYGQCKSLTTCSLYDKQSSCFLGTDGQCLWIQGACYVYYGCTSIKWNTQKQCSKISSQCTTNGSNCVPINSCANTNTDGGCVIGTEGECLQSVQFLTSTLAPTCMTFNSCFDAFYSTHQQCQMANPHCTTKLTGCIPLSDCNTYTNEAGCQINALGIQKNNLQKIISTGLCVWDSVTSSCRDQSCEDFIGYSESQCNSFLISCTFNAKNCITKLQCQNYSQTVCMIAKGVEGKCVWEQYATTGQCRVIACSDVRDGLTTNYCNNSVEGCVSDGSKCIPKTECGKYLTEIGCRSNGTDGICIWDSKTCTLMTSCQSANSDSVACLQRFDACYWKIQSDGSTSCTQYTCNTNFVNNGTCGPFLSYDKKSLTICEDKGDQLCVETNPILLGSASSCYPLTQGYYYWNPSSSTCNMCNSTISTNNNNQLNNTNTTVSSFSLVLVAEILLILSTSI